MTHNMPVWLRLDNAAKIYPSFASQSDTGTFRAAVILYEKVNSDILKQALSNIIERFPSMSLRLRKGFFWYYFEANNKELIVKEESLSPCKAIEQEKNNNYLFKVLYYNRRIAVECFHALTDGYGGLEFLKSLVFEYLSLKYINLEHNNEVITRQTLIDKSELVDSYKQYYLPEENVMTRPKTPKAYRIKGKTIKNHDINVTSAVMNAKEIKLISKRYQVTITTLLTSILIKTLIDNSNDKALGEYIVISVPINLRKIFPSKSMRNFTYFVNVRVVIDKSIEFSSILQQVQKQIKDGVKKDTLYSHIHHNVKMEAKLLMRITPNYFKDIILKNIRRFTSKRTVTTTLTNPGIITMPDSVKQYIEHFEFILYAGKTHAINTGVCTYNNRLVITISRAIKSPKIVNDFFYNIANITGSDIEIYCNRGDKIW